MTLDEIHTEMLRLSRLLDRGITAIADSAREYGEAENEYRKAKAQAWVSAPDGTVPERLAWVDGRCSDLRLKRDLAEGMRQAALEAVRSRRQQLSALQSIAAAYRAEAEMTRFGPSEAA